MQAQIARESDFGANDRQCTVVTHLGSILTPGCYAWGAAARHGNKQRAHSLPPGYNTETAQFSEQDMTAWHDGRSMPSVILVKKAYIGACWRCVLFFAPPWLG